MSKPNDSNSGNCQDFIDDVLRKLNININFSGSLGLFIESLRKKGKGEMVFEMIPSFKDRFGQKESKVLFQSHQKLDEFVKKLKEMDVEFDLNYP